MSGPAAAITTSGDILMYGGLLTLAALSLLSAVVRRRLDPTHTAHE